MNNFQRNIYRTVNDEGSMPPFNGTVNSFISNCGEGYVILISTVTLNTPALADTIFTIRTDLTLTSNCGDTYSRLNVVEILAGQTFGSSEGCAISGQLTIPDGSDICSTYVL